MPWDYFVFLADNANLQESLARPEGLAGGFVDEVSVRFFQSDKENARNRYMQHARGDINIPDLILQTVPDFSNVLSSDWLAFQVDFELLTPGTPRTTGSFTSWTTRCARTESLACLL